MSRGNNEELVVVKGSVSRDLKFQFKVLCTQNELTMSLVLDNLIKKWIQAGGPIFESTTDLTDLSNQDFQEVKGYIPESLKLQFKVLCTTKQVTMRFVLYNLIKEWVSSGGLVNQS